MRGPIQKVAFLVERNEKDDKYYQVYDKYRPDYKKCLITRKFYSKYEEQCMDVADPEIIEKIQRAKYDTPREKYDWPQTENQRYGWFIESLVPENRDDNRFYHPRKYTDFIAHELQLKMDESALPKAKFTGIPFKFR